MRQNLNTAAWGPSDLFTTDKVMANNVPGELATDEPNSNKPERTFTDGEILTLVGFIHAGAVIKDADEKRAVIKYFVRTGRTMGLNVDEFGVYTGRIGDKSATQNPAGPVRILKGKTPPTHPFALERGAR